MERPPAWSQQKEQLLETIIGQTQNQNKWNFIARQLFLRSKRSFFRNPKQCRERWMNHLDPTKKRTQWTQEQDLTLLNCIKRKGKKWSMAVKQLNKHMVKNKNKSLISHKSKKQPSKKQSEKQFILMKKLNQNFIKPIKIEDKHQITVWAQAKQFEKKYFFEQITKMNQNQAQVSTQSNIVPTNQTIIYDKIVKLRIRSSKKNSYTSIIQYWQKVVTSISYCIIEYEYNKVSNYLTMTVVCIVKMV